MKEFWHVHCPKCGTTFQSHRKDRPSRYCPNKAKHDPNAKLVRRCDMSCEIFRELSKEA